MNSKTVNYQRFLIILFLASVFCLAIIKIEDTDTWMHLSFGRLIWASKGLPATETFVYTALGKPLSYSSWLFGLLYYMAYRMFNVYGVILLMAVTVTAAFFILVRDSLRPYKNYTVSLIVLAAMVILVRHRFVERPDTFMMVFLSLSIFSLNAYVYDSKKYLFFLPLVHMIWANCHSSINLMFIPFGAFLAGGLIQRLLIKKGFGFAPTPTPSQLQTIFIVFLASFAASLISPYFINQYLLGPHYMATSWFKQEIIELRTPTWEMTKAPYLLAASIIVSFALNMRRFSVIHCLLVAPFVVLSFTAYRFIFLLGIVSGPVLARNISSFLAARAWEKFASKRAALVATALCIFIYPLFFFLQSAPFEAGRKEFGFGINYKYIPEKALQYMDNRGIEGRMLQPFGWGGYVIWRDFPKRSVFVDPRGDIPVGLLEEMQLARSRYAVMDDLAAKYRIEAVLMETPLEISDPTDNANFDPLFSNPQWALVYWDDVSVLYIKRGGRYDPVIQRDEYRFIKPAKNIRAVSPGLYDERYRENVIAELKRNAAETHSATAYYYLSFVYNEVGLYREAIAAAEEVLKMQGGNLVDATNSIAYAYLRLGNLDESIRYYKKSFSLQEDATISYNLGIGYLNKGDTENALRYLKKALALNKNLMSVYPTLISIYQELGNKGELEKTRRLLETATTEYEGEAHFKKGLEAYWEGKLDLAAAEYRKSIEANPANPVVYSNLGYVFYDMRSIDKAFAYQKKAVDIDPNYANAYYGLALIYKDEGDLGSAKRQWEEYLRIEPDGYYSRRAAEEIEAINKLH